MTVRRSGRCAGDGGRSAGDDRDPRHPEDVIEVRRWVRGLLGRDHPAVHDVALVATEIFTNAVRHSDSGSLGNDVAVVAIALDRAIRVELVDAGSSRGGPRMRDAGADAVRGRGLPLVDALTCGRWGGYDDDAGRTVWAEVTF